MMFFMKAAAAAVVAAICFGSVTGCSPKEEPAPPAAGGTGATDTGAAAAPRSAATVTDGKKDLKEAVCVICAANEGRTTPEAVKASVEYKGKGYYFCNEAEKAEFINNPQKYAVQAK